MLSETYKSIIKLLCKNAKKAGFYFTEFNNSLYKTDHLFSVLVHKDCMQEYGSLGENEVKLISCHVVFGEKLITDAALNNI